MAPPVTGVPGGRVTQKVTRGISATGFPTISAEETVAPETMEERTTRRQTCSTRGEPSRDARIFPGNRVDA